MKNSLGIDFETFVCLTAAIAAAGCGQQKTPLQPDTPRPAPPGMVIASAEPDPEPETSPEPDTVASAAPEPDPNACNNDKGDVACDAFESNRFRGPACEGFIGVCELLKKGSSYRLRVGAEAARCMEQKGMAACNIQVRHLCYRQALQVACPDPQFNSLCADKLARCKQKHQRPDFTQEDCVKALSGITGGDLDWAKDAMGPSSEGCKLMFPVF